MDGDAGYTFSVDECMSLLLTVTHARSVLAHEDVREVASVAELEYDLKVWQERLQAELGVVKIEHVERSVGDPEDQLPHH